MEYFLSCVTNSNSTYQFITIDHIVTWIMNSKTINGKTCFMSLSSRNNFHRGLAQDFWTVASTTNPNVVGTCLCRLVEEGNICGTAFPYINNRFAFGIFFFWSFTNIEITCMRELVSMITESDFNLLILVDSPGAREYNGIYTDILNRFNVWKRYILGRIYFCKNVITL